MPWPPLLSDCSESWKAERTSAATSGAELAAILRVRAVRSRKLLSYCWTKVLSGVGS